jgi:hypothetical protein
MPTLTIPETEISSRGLHDLHRTLGDHRRKLGLDLESGPGKILHDVLLELEAAALFGAELLEQEPQTPVQAYICQCWFSLNTGPNGECEKCGGISPRRVAQENR